MPSLFRLFAYGAFIFALIVVQPGSARSSIEDDAAMEAECNALLKGIPNADMIAGWQKKNAPQVYDWLGRFNGSLSAEMRLTDEQIKTAFHRFLFLDLNDFLLMKELLSADSTDAAMAVDPQFSVELQGAVRTWIRSLADGAEPTREEIRHRPFYEPWPMSDWPGLLAPFNSVQERLKELLSARQLVVEALVGQKLFDEHELAYYASSVEGYARMLKLLNFYEQKKPAGTVPILELKQKIGLVLEAQKTPYKRGSVRSVPIGTDEIAAAVSTKNDPGIYAELDYYVELTRREKNGDLQGISTNSLASVRMRHWTGPTQTMLQSVESRVRDAVQLAYDRLEKASQEVTPPARWNEARVEYLGSWQTLTPPKSFLGFSLGGDQRPTIRRADIFGVSVPVGKSVRHFAVQTIPKYFGEPRTLADTTYQDLDELEIKDIRETSVEARVQDAFATVPERLKEPMLVLKGSTGRYFATEPNQLLIDEIKVRPGEEDAARTEMRARIRQITVNHFGGTTTPVARIRFFRDFTELSLPMKLEFVSGDGLREIYSEKLPTSAISSDEWTLERNLVTQEIKLTFVSRAGLGRLQITTRRWDAQFVIP